MPVNYIPGDVPIVVTARGLVALPSGVPVALAALIWQRVRDGQGLAAVLEALTDVFGASLTALPPFAVALTDGSAVRLAVRGGLAVTVETPSGRESISASGVTTWVERVVEGVTRVEVRQAVTTPMPAPDDADASPGASGRGGQAATFDLPLLDGVVLASGAEWIPEAVPAAAASAHPSLFADADAPEPQSQTAEQREQREPEPAVDSQPEPAVDSQPEPAVDSEPDSATESEPSPPEPVQVTPTPSAAHGEQAPGRGPWSALAVTPPPLPPAPAAAPAPATAPAPAADQPASELIDSAAVLSAVDADTLLPTTSTIIPPRPAAPETEAIEATTGYDHLWGMTVVRSVEDAAVREVEADEDADAAESGAPPAEGGDHDGATISVAQLRAMRGGVADSAPPPPLAPPRLPAPGRLRMSTGQVLVLDRTVVIGRRPRATRMTGTDLPHLVAVDSPQQDISRSHVEIRVEGGAILATDLRTTNGTTLRRPGSDPVRLHPGEATMVVTGDVIDLGDGITVSVEDPS